MTQVQTMPPHRAEPSFTDKSRINAPRVSGSLTQIDIEAMHDNTAPAEYRATSISRFSPVGNLPRA